MTRTVLGQLDCGGKLLYLEEAPPEQAQLESLDTFSVQLKLSADEVDLDLASLRKLKRILAEGERLLLHRHDQATKARNLQLDL